MTVKGEDPPIVHAQMVNSDPEIDLTEPTKATMVGSSSSNTNNKPSHNPSYVPTAPSSNNNNQQGTTTTTTTTYVTAPPNTVGGSHGNYGREPCNTTCSNCHQQTRTKVTHRIDGVTILAVVLLLLFFWPLFFLPLIIPACKTTEHYCKNCNCRLAKEEPC